MSIPPKFIAYEYDGEGDFNDEGSIESSCNQAWEVVSHVFSPEHTVIENLRTGERFRIVTSTTFTLISE